MTAAAAPAIDDKLLANVADGHRWSFIVAALAKRGLQIPGIKPADRLRVLERLNSLTDDWFTADMLAGIAPMCDTGYAIFKEAKSLDAAQDNTHCQASFEVLATLKVFRHFCTLNPSIMAAIKQRAVWPAGPARSTAADRNTAAASADRNGRCAVRSHATPLERHAGTTQVASPDFGPDKPHGRRPPKLDL